MSLDWHIDKCKDWEKLYDGGEWPATEGLIYATLHVGLNQITEANAVEFSERAEMLWAGMGMGMGGSGLMAERAYSLAEIKRRIGLSTNAVTFTKAQFNANLIRMMRDEAHRRTYNQARKESEIAA